MQESLLTSEQFVKNISNISDNLAGKYLLPAIREAQEINLRGFLGDALLDKLKTLVGTGTIRQPGNEAYRRLTDECQYFLAYQSIAGLPYKIGFKLANIGVAKTSDTNVQPCTSDELAAVKGYYQGKADYYAKRLQNYLLAHSEEYPELNDNDCYQVRKNLYSAASCGLWLGGARGKKMRQL